MHSQSDESPYKHYHTIGDHHIPVFLLVIINVQIKLVQNEDLKLEKALFALQTITTVFFNNLFDNLER